MNKIKIFKIISSVAILLNLFSPPILTKEIHSQLFTHSYGVPFVFFEITTGNGGGGILIVELIRAWTLPYVDLFMLLINIFAFYLIFCVGRFVIKKYLNQRES